SKTDVMLGYDDLASYEKGGVYGAVIGRYANRIGSNGSFPLDGKTIQLERASPDQKIVIHGGTAGFQKKVWHAQMHDGTEPSLELTVVSPDGDGGFPGALTTTLVYTVTRDNELMLDYRAISDRPTVVNMTNHAYFALQGEGNGDVAPQRMQVFADRYTMSFETQHYPDSPNRPEFPSTVVTPSTPLHEVTVYKFSTGK